jgi:hypothetical protein
MERVAPTLSGPDIPGFLFLEYVKQMAYSVCIHSSEHLKQRIMEAAATVTPGVLVRV